MQIFIDTGNVKEIETWLKQGVVDGATTNPTIMLKDGISDIRAGAQQLCKLLGAKPVSIEVTTNDVNDMLDQARMFASWSDNLVIKIPVVNEQGESCLGVVHKLTSEGVSVNCTAILSFNQAMLATKAGATYVSIFAGRVADEGNDPAQLIRNVRQWIDTWGYTARIIVGSIRTVMDIQTAALAGAHILTVPPQFFPKLVDHKYSRDTVRQFNRDAEKAFGESKTFSAVMGR